MTFGGAVLAVTVVACAHRVQPVERGFAEPTIADATTPDSGENELDLGWRQFCDLLAPTDGGFIVMREEHGTVSCQNHTITRAPIDGGPPRSWKVKPWWPEAEVFSEYMRECRLLDWDVGLEGLIDGCRVICVNRQVALITTLDGGACGHGEWMKEDPRVRMGDYAPFGAPWDQGPPPLP